MSDAFYIALAGTIGAFFAMIPAGILAWATLVKVRQLRQETQELKTEMNGHMSKVLEVTASEGRAVGELKGRADRSAEIITETIRNEGRDLKLAPATHTEIVADAQATAKDAQETAKDAQSVAKNLTEEAT